jgi:ribosomal protein S18 acetylase RimI-like enzyme
MEIRKAVLEDLSAIVKLLADDELGSLRERYQDPLPSVYVAAFLEMERQAGNGMLVAVEQDEVIGCLQLTYIPGIARMGMIRAQIEGVRVRADYRSQGVGEALFTYAIESARAKGCGLVQLTTDKSRVNAQRFYDRLGFVPSHEGLKLSL